MRPIFQAKRCAGCVVLALVGVLALTSCSRSAGEVDALVLYSSVDDYVLAEAVAAFEAETGIRVRVVGDTEATKTTGLVTRLLSEHQRGQDTADVWWSSEPFGSVQLAQGGVLIPFHFSEVEAAFEGGWPSSLRAVDGTWAGHGLRARVIAHSTDRVAKPPQTLAELTQEPWSNRVGLARPRFGTTRGHMGALLHAWGAERFEDWLDELAANGVRVYDSNSSVVRAITQGEIDVALTDTDDVLVGQARGWAVGMAEPTDSPLAVPCTVGLVAGGSNPEHGETFVRWLLSGKGEAVLAQSESQNHPVHPGVTGGHLVAIPVQSSGWYESIAASIPEAMRICERVLPGS